MIRVLCAVVRKEQGRKDKVEYTKQRVLRLNPKAEEYYDDIEFVKVFLDWLR